MVGAELYRPPQHGNGLVVVARRAQDAGAAARRLPAPREATSTRRRAWSRTGTRFAYRHHVDGTTIELIQLA